MGEMFTIPAKGNEIHLSDEIRFYLISQVPEGRLTRDEDIRAFLCKLYGASCIDFEQPIKMRYISDYHKYWYSVIKNIPFHRVVSCSGEVHNLFDMDRLEKEKFTLVSKMGSMSKTVKDFKKYLFDFERETTIDLLTLAKVSNEGVDQFFKNV